MTMKIGGNIVKFQSELKAEDRRRRKAATTAARVEAYRLMKVLKKEIRAGAPGGRKFAPLTELAKRTSGRGLNRAPLRRLAIPVRYWVNNRPNRYTVSIGYRSRTIVDSHGGYATLTDGKTPSSRSRLSASWIKIATLAQAGGSHPATNRLHEFFAHIGGQLSKGRNRKIAGYFFIRRNLKRFKDPARPIIDPFWAAHRAEAMNNIRRNFARKLAGERI